VEFLTKGKKSLAAGAISKMLCTVGGNPEEPSSRSKPMSNAFVITKT
jgi:hypothetical protein